MSVLGWHCPWSGDESDPIPRRYWLWYRLYRSTRRAKHHIGWHDWEPMIMGGARCGWCGGLRGLPRKVTP